MCVPYGAPVRSPRHDGSRLISAYWFSQLPLSAQMTLLIHGRVLNPFRLTAVELNRKKRKKRKKIVVHGKIIRGLSRSDLTKQMDLNRLGQGLGYF